MAYSDKDDIIERLSEIELIDLASEGITLDSGALAATATAINDADREIDSYVSSRYNVPFSTVPDLIKKISVELAIVNLNKKRNIFTDDTVERAKWAKDMLEKLAKGTISLDIDTSGEDFPQRIQFTSDELRGW